MDIYIVVLMHFMQMDVQCYIVYYYCQYIIIIFLILQNVYICSTKQLNMVRFWIKHVSSITSKRMVTMCCPTSSIKRLWCWCNSRQQVKINCIHQLFIITIDKKKKVLNIIHFNITFSIF